jgi:hypothetical protein
MPLQQLDVRREGVCVAGRSVEPLIPVEKLLAALDDDNIEHFRPLLPVGYEAVASAYARVAAQITVADLSDHYTTALEFFHDEFVPVLKQRLRELSGDCWDLDDYVAFAAGSDVDLIGHLIEAVAAREAVHLLPGDWYGFLVGSTQQQNIHWRSPSNGGLACLCVPSVRNGHFTNEMSEFLNHSSAALLNLNLFPTLIDEERHAVANALRPILPKAVLSISFSRGFALTASQLGVFLVPRDHPYVRRFEQQWNWYTYFFNAIAAKAFLELDFDAIGRADAARRRWVQSWLKDRSLPSIPSGSYYVKSFRPVGTIPAKLKCLTRDGLIRLCFKPPQTG